MPLVTLSVKPCMYVVFHSNFAACIVCRRYKPCEFLGLVWTDCWGNKSDYDITSPANYCTELLRIWHKSACLHRLWHATFVRKSDLLCITNATRWFFFLNWNIYFSEGVIIWITTVQWYNDIFDKQIPLMNWKTKQNKQKQKQKKKKPNNNNNNNCN